MLTSDSNDSGKPKPGPEESKLPREDHALRMFRNLQRRLSLLRGPGKDQHLDPSLLQGDSPESPSKIESTGGSKSKATQRSPRSRKSPRGILVAVEGIDGSGKSTQVTRLHEELGALGYRVCLTREPTNGQYGKQIREAALTERFDIQKETELFLMDREEHVTTVIKPALDDGMIVLTDRYYLSTIAYQGVRGMDPEELLKRNKHFPMPDLMVLLEIPVAEAVRRIKESRGDSLDEFEKAEHLEGCRRLFQKYLGHFPRFGVIDASDSVSRITAMLLGWVEDVYEGRWA